MFRPFLYVWHYLEDSAQVHYFYRHGPGHVLNSSACIGIVCRIWLEFCTKLSGHAVQCSAEAPFEPILSCYRVSAQSSTRGSGFGGPRRRGTDVLMVINVAVFAAQFLSKDKLLLWGAKVSLTFTSQALALGRTPAHVLLAVNLCEAMRHAPSQADNCVRQACPPCYFARCQSCQAIEVSTSKGWQGGDQIQILAHSRHSTPEHVSQATAAALMANARH